MIFVTKHAMQPNYENTPTIQSHFIEISFILISDGEDENSIEQEKKTT